MSNINLTGETKLSDLLEKFPKLKEDLQKINPNFNLLSTPLAETMIPIANLKMIAEKGGIDLDTLIEKVKELISKY